MTTTPPAADGTEPGTGPGRWGWLAAGIWLFYLSQPFQKIVQTHAATRVVGLVVLFLFAASYVAYFAWVRWAGLGVGKTPTWKRLAYLTGMTGLCFLLLPSAGQTALTCLVYIAAVAMMALDIRIAAAVVLVML